MEAIDANQGLFPRDTFPLQRIPLVSRDFADRDRSSISAIVAQRERGYE